MALSVGDQGQSTGTQVTADNATTVGDLIMIAIQGGGANNPTVTDNVDTGAYTAVATSYSVASNYLTLLYKVVNVSGTPTITASAADRIAFMRFSGFQHAATVLTADYATATNTGTSLSVAIASASQASEYAYGMVFGGGNLITATGQFSTASILDGYCAELYMGSSDVPSSVSKGSSITMAGTFGSSTTWAGLVVGFYDMPSVGVTTSFVRRFGGRHFPS